MAQNRASIHIDAPVETVFEVVSDIRRYSKAIPHIVRTELLTDGEVGVGTRFRETRLMRGREATMEMEVVEYEQDDHVRIVADANGAVWDSVFTVRPDGQRTRLTLTMDARPHTVLAKLTMPLVSRLLQGALEADMEAVRAYCEQPDPGPETPR